MIHPLMLITPSLAVCVSPDFKSGSRNSQLIRACKLCLACVQPGSVLVDRLVNRCFKVPDVFRQCPVQQAVTDDQLVLGTKPKKPSQGSRGLAVGRYTCRSQLFRGVF